jgi:hypothetical protein
MTRLNRAGGFGQALITHTMNDFQSLPTEEDRRKAEGFVERSGMVITGGQATREMGLLTQVVPMSQAEQDLLVSWSTPGTWDSATGKETAPPGQGKFLLKVGGRPGIPFHVDLTAAELAVNDTNQLWHETSRVGSREEM